jgi:isopentenyl-diphosphate Delta-isomerase
MTRSALTRLVDALPARVDGWCDATCQALGFDRCQLSLDAALPSGVPVELVLSAHDDQVVRFEATPGDAEAGDHGVLQITELRPATPSDAVLHDSLMTGLRKDAHLALCTHEDVEAAVADPGFGGVTLRHVALPEMDASSVDPALDLWGRTLQLPLIIAGMTGGSARGAEVNRMLAVVAQEAGIGMGVGSQRRMLQDPDLAWTYRVRDLAPDILLLANIGAVQLNYGVTPQQCAELVEAIGADVLCLHLNALQERVQPEGELDFSALLERIEEVVEASAVPVILKETGCGMSAHVTRQALDAGCAGVDVAGVGGTSWARVEALRQADPVQRAVGHTFRDWGIPTTRAITSARSVGDAHVVIGSGGVRDGLHVAKAIALGADACAMALPFLRAVLQSERDAADLVRQVGEELRTAMFCSSTVDLHDLRAAGISPAEGAHHA